MSSALLCLAASAASIRVFSNVCSTTERYMVETVCCTTLRWESNSDMFVQDRQDGEQTGLIVQGLPNEGWKRWMDDIEPTTHSAEQGHSSLVVSVTEEAALQSLEEDVTTSDRVPSQVTVDVIVTELSEDAGGRLGLEWQYPHDQPDILGDRSLFQGVGKLDGEFYKALAVLEDQGEARAKTNPGVIVNCGTESTIDVHRTNQYGETDARLTIVPTIVFPDKISLNTDVAVNTYPIAGLDTAESVTRQQADIELICLDGETMMIGSLSAGMESGGKQSCLVIFVMPHALCGTNGLQSSDGITK